MMLPVGILFGEVREVSAEGSHLDQKGAVPELVYGDDDQNDYDGWCL